MRNSPLDNSYYTVEGSINPWAIVSLVAFGLVLGDFAWWSEA